MPERPDEAVMELLGVLLQAGHDLDYLVETYTVDQLQLMAMSIVQHRLNTFRVGVELLGFGQEGGSAVGSRGTARKFDDLPDEEKQRRQEIALAQLGMLQQSVGQAVRSGQRAPARSTKGSSSPVANADEARVQEQLQKVKATRTGTPTQDGKSGG